MYLGWYSPAQFRALHCAAKSVRQRRDCDASKFARKIRPCGCRISHPKDSVEIAMYTNYCEAILHGMMRYN